MFFETENGKAFLRQFERLAEQYGITDKDLALLVTKDDELIVQALCLSIKTRKIVRASQPKEAS